MQLAAEGLPPGLDEELLSRAGEALSSVPKPRRKDTEQVAETIRLAVRRAAEPVWGKKPVVKVAVLRV
jgi:ribonuclease J